jgi:hypothetical protein
MYINTYGCDKFPSQYTFANVSDGAEVEDYYYKLRFGKMFLPVCTNPKAQPILSSVMFITFIILCGFILINITIAAVTAGINDRLDELRREDLEHEMGVHRAVSQLSNVELNRPTLLTDPDMLLLLMQQVWKEHDEYAKKMARLNTNERADKQKKEEEASKRKISTNQVAPPPPSTEQASLVLKGHGHISHESFDFNDTEDGNQVHWWLFLCEWRYQSMFMRDLTGHLSYHMLVAFLVLVAAATEMIVLQRDDSSAYAEKIQIALQLLFSLDLYCSIIATYPNYPIFFKSRWNVFDAVLVLLTWIPVINTAFHGHGTKVVGLLRVLRILRLLKMLTWIPELNVILHSIGSSVRALVYVIMLLFAFFFHFGIAGIFLFAENDPRHFGSLWQAFVTLFQVTSHYPCSKYACY